MKKQYKIAIAVVVVAGIGAFIMRDTPKEREQKYIKRGNEYFEQGENLKARIEYKNAAKLAPTDPEVSYRWGLVDESEGEIRNAYANFYTAEQQSPHYAPVLEKLAHYYIAADKEEDAQKKINIILADNPGDPEGHALQAAIYLRVKDYAATEKEARIALDKDPGNITAIAVLTGMYFDQNNLNKAGEVLDEGISHNPKAISLLMLKTKIYETPFNAAKIKEAYQAIFALKPKDTQFRLMLAQAYIGANMLNDAEETLRKGVTDVPGDWNIKHALVNFLGHFRGVDSAEKQVHDFMKDYPTHSELYLWLADIYVAHNDAGKATAILQELVAKNSDDTQSLNAKTSLARINFDEGNKELANKIVADVLEKKPSNRDALFIRANMEISSNMLENAVSDLRIIIRDEPKTKDARQLLAEVLLKQGYTDLAIETLNQLVDIDPTDPAIRTRLAQLYSVNHDTVSAMDQLNIVTTSNPNYPVGWESTARVAIETKNFELANSSIQKLDALPNQHETATYLKGLLASASGRNDEAVALYKSVIEKDPAAPIGQHALQSLLAARSKPDELAQTASYIASLKSNDPFVETVLGECYIKLGKMDIAAESFDKAIAAHPNSQEPYLDRAGLFFADKKYQDAIDILEKAEKNVPGDTRAAIMIGTIYYNQKQFKEAVDVYEDILKVNPSLTVAANNYASIIDDHFYTDPAMLEKGKQAIERFANTPEPTLLDTLGWTYYRLNKLDMAEAIFARATTKPNLSPEIHYHYGATLLKMGNKERAKQELQKAVANNPHYPAVDDAKKLLEGL